MQVKIEQIIKIFTKHLKEKNGTSTPTKELYKAIRKTINSPPKEKHKRNFLLYKIITIQ